MDTNRYRAFHLLMLLCKLGIIGFNRHRITHAATLLGVVTSIPMNAIMVPAPAASTYDEYLHFVPLRNAS